MKHLVGCAHAHGMKVFLDVITHGVMKDSPLVEEHPDWFLGGSWGMADYDWYGGHAELDEWWVNTWLWYVTEIGVDGFRLDVSHYRNDLWAVPVFMAGEEFNADYRPLPGLSPNLFGGEPFGKGRWLYGSWIEWEKSQERLEHSCMKARQSYRFLIIIKMKKM